MSLTSIGDLAQSFFLRHRSNDVKSEMLRLTSELSSGEKSDLGRALQGDFASLAAVERGLRLNAVFQTATAEAALFAGARQNALETVQNEVSDLAPVLLSATGAGQFSRLAVAAADAGEKLDLAIGALNTRIAGRSLFSGDRPDQPALRPAEDILAALAPIMDSAVDAQDAITLIEDWFLAPGGGYETFAYLGGTGPAPGFAVAEGEIVSDNATALDPGLREALMGLALAALVGNGNGPADEANRRALLQEAGTRMLTSQDALSLMRADLGSAEARIEEARVRAEATAATLSIERNRLVGADPYETATELEAVQMQLESLYILTTRMARLNLTEFLR